MTKPTKPCGACGSSDWWQRPDGGWRCGRCHPKPNSEEGGLAPEKAHSLEVLTLRGRVILGNKKLNDAWEQIKGIADDKEQWAAAMDRWRQASEKLSLLCSELKARGYEDCLYRDDQGRKTVSCLGQGGIGCRVCPSKIPYWEQELMALPGPRVKQTEHGVEQAKFLKKLGGRAAD